MDRFLIIDGNSLINRAFFGVKLLTTKDGRYTNALFGFMNIFLHLQESLDATHVAVAFDLKAPTFRHKRYGAYKAERKPMPPELFEQMEPLKEILSAYGCHIVSCEGFEADDILGTLSHAAEKTCRCYIATGDRDSLQLVRENVRVLLTSTKAGQTVTKEYGPEALMEEYGVSPEGMIEIKALQGDSSDNIPGVAGVGPKTAGELIRKYGSIDRIYADLDALDVTKNVREKLRADRENAFLSRELGTIVLNAPIDTDPEHYRLAPQDREKLRELLARYELFRLIGKLGLKESAARAASKAPEEPGIVYDFCVCGAEEAKKRLAADSPLYALRSVEAGLLLVSGKTLYCVPGGAEAQIRLLSALVADGRREWVTPQTKQFCRLAGQYGLDLPLPAFDPVLAAYILNPNTSDYGAAALAMTYRLQPPALKAAGDTHAPLSEHADVKDAVLMPGLCERLRANLTSNGQLTLLTEMEIPLARVLAEMEMAGMAVDTQAIRSYSEILQQRIDRLQARIYEAAGERFNINSPKQLGTVLFEKMKLPAKKKTKTGYSTNAEVLEELARENPFAALILDYRTYAKLKSTYCDGLLKAAGDDGRIHSTFTQTETRTGRLSSTEPNLQNIPVRTEIGKEFRKFFVAPEGRVLVDADYSQIELRVLAALSADAAMLDCFERGEDIHTATAAKVFGVPPENVTADLRSKAKAVNFGIVYGIGAFSLAKDIHTSREEAERFIEAYLALYADVNAYMHSSIESAKKKGYAETYFKRRRYLPELRASNFQTRSFGERVARNMPIQGTAADIIKLAMIRVRDRLLRELPACRLIMQVHDELIIEAPEADAPAASRLLKEEMEHAARLGVVLKTDVGYGKTWYDAKG